jgi:hypothetical protein
LHDHAEHRPRSTSEVRARHSECPPFHPLSSARSQRSRAAGEERVLAAVGDAAAFEEATASRGLLAVQYNRRDLYGHTDESADALDAIRAGRGAALPWSSGLDFMRRATASCMTAEKTRVVALTDHATQGELETSVPLIQQGQEGEPLQPV